MPVTRHRAVSAVGVFELDGYAARVDVTVNVPAGADEELAARDALKALGAKAPSAGDVPGHFGLFGRWPQFFDGDVDNDFVRQFYNPSGQPPTGGDYQAAFLAGQIPWTDVPTSAFSFDFGGTTARCPSGFILCGGAPDGFNDVSWLPLDSSTLGATFTFFPRADPQVILEADVIMNSEFEWFADPAAATPTSFDTQHVMLHENGHIAGLAHSADPQAVMARFLSPGELGPRVLTQDDIAAISTLYPLEPVESVGGDLDLTFGSDGKVTTDFPGAVASTQDQVTALALPDGKILAAGDVIDPIGGLADFALTRYNPDGSLDTGFGTGGRGTSDLGGDDHIADVALQSDGKLVAAGFVIDPDTGLADFALARYSPDGSLDTDFGTGGTVTTDLVGDDAAFGVAVQPDGGIVAAGTVGSSLAGPFDFALVRYDPQGLLDPNFGDGGTVTTDFGGDFEQAFGTALDPDGRIVVAGFTNAGGSLDFAVARHLSDGSLDTTFAADGTVTTDFTGNTDQANALAIQSDGRIVVAGLARVGGGFDFALARYLSDGSLDTAFDTDGRVTTDFTGGTDRAFDAALQRDGKIVAAGRAATAGGTDFALARYDTAGALDTGFDTDGQVTTDFTGGGDAAFDVAVQLDGKVVAAGRAATAGSNDFALVRYNPDGALDASFDTDGKVTTDFEVVVATESAWEV